MYYSPEGLLQLVFIAILFLVIFGPGIWLVSKAKERKGINTSEPKESDKVVYWGVGLTLFVLIVLASLKSYFSS